MITVFVLIIRHGGLIFNPLRISGRKIFSIKTVRGDQALFEKCGGLLGSGGLLESGG